MHVLKMSLLVAFTFQILKGLPVCENVLFDVVRSKCHCLPVSLISLFKLKWVVFVLLLLVLRSRIQAPQSCTVHYRVHECEVVLVSLGRAALIQCACLSCWQVTNPEAVLLPREIVARGLLDVLREFSDNENDFISVMETVARMSEDGGRFYFVCQLLI